MALAILQSLFCICRHDRPELEQGFDETSRLISPIMEPPTIYSDDRYIQYQRMQERFSTIVRAKGGKMVNVASRIPFNLHNQVLPVETSRHSSSRSASSSGGHLIDEPYHPHHNYYDVYTDRESAGHRKRYPRVPNDDMHPHPRTNRSRPSSITREEDPSHGTRSNSSIRVQPKPSQLLNVRLVGYIEERRGRAQARDLVLPSGSRLTETDGAAVVDDSNDGDRITPKENFQPTFKFHDTGPLVITWPTD